MTGLPEEGKEETSDGRKRFAGAEYSFNKVKMTLWMCFQCHKCGSSLINVQTYVAVVVGGAVLGGLVAALAVTDGVGGRDCGIGGWRGRSGGGNLTVVVRP